MTPEQLFNAASDARVRASRSRRLADFDEAVELSRRAVATISDRHQATALAGLAGALQERYLRTSEDTDLYDAIEAGRAAVASGGDMSAWMNLAAALALRFRRTETRVDADAAVVAGHQVLVNMPSGDPDWATALSNQALLLTEVHRRFGTGLDAALDLHRRAVEAAADDSARHAITLLNWSMALLEAGEVAAAVEAAARALAGTREDDPIRPAILSQLGSGLRAYGQLDDAVVAFQAAVTSDPGNAGYRGNLGSVLYDRFKLYGAIADLDAAERAIGRAAAGAYGAERARYLAQAGTILRTRFDLSGDVTWLRRALAVGERAVDLLPPGHPERADHLVNVLGTVVRLLEYDPAGVDAGLAESAAREAVRTARDAARRAAALVQLGQVLRRDSPRLAEAAGHTRAAVALLPPGSPDRAAYLANLAGLIEESAADPTAAAAAWAEAADDTTGPAAVRLAAARERARLVAEQRGPAAAADHYGTAVRDLLPLLAWPGVYPADQRRILRSHAYLLATDAAACAIDAHCRVEAVELLEHGRAVLWGRMLDDRRTLAALSAAGSPVAARLRRIRAELDQDSH
ncbi:hypothetical protein EYA84_01255 [Verrucosispora sp. SN26_14.1]|uniref:hypothetical protein n=1 Tax=Verrucosispora sp. SN26_14.1 TaxID=2527879 RepID=UPI0010331B7C|nr:hypothetical protein [Verrucosispora sp. SN26_14.1]TBL44910.1 hypothetical protein EYA84_01255 [Verrucosispora sp. SN26_14.1]